MGKKKTIEQFIAESISAHENKYDYSLVKYKGYNIPVQIICPIHGIFKQNPTVHTSGRGCYKCGKVKSTIAAKKERITRKTTKQFIKDAIKVHGNFYDYSLVDYQGVRKKIKIICPIHGEFQQYPQSHLNGNKCKKCYLENNERTKTLEIFIKDAIKTHGNLYDYSLVDYINSKTKVKIICKKHNVFFQKPIIHINGSGCPKCSKYFYSKISIQWLNQIMKENGIFIQHAENEGEFFIPGTKFRADGFCKETNTIYEFHGDAYHGNLNRYKPDEKCHPFNKSITAKELNDKTIEKEKFIKALGFNLITIWESDYHP